MVAEIKSDNRRATRIPTSIDTHNCLRSLKRGGETYDELIRRYIISGEAKLIENMTDAEQAWVKNESI
jgi:hypothetical protein